MILNHIFNWRSIILIFFLILAIDVNGQVINKDTLLSISTYVLKTQEQRKARIKKFIEKGNDFLKSNEKRDIALIDITKSGRPIYYKTFNADAAQITGVSSLYDGGTLGLSLSGKSMVVGVWDGGLVKDHVEFGSRLQTLDDQSDISNHSTHVTGTIIAQGINPSAKGMAYEAQARTYDFTNDLSEIAMEASNGLILSNHSYGLITGWDINNSGNWEWFGDASISATEDYLFGFYNSKSRTLDDIAYNAPFYTMLWAAGNDRGDVGNGNKPADGNGGSGFDSIGPEGAAKNVIAVGAIEKFSDYTEPTDIHMSSFSSWGPVDDGRIKPDIVAVGVNVFSTSAEGKDTYTTLSGTSMATPNVTGGVALLQELYNNKYGVFMRSATVKALLIQSAKEAGRFEGPDYKFGWGLFDAEKAARIILKDGNGQVTITENTLADGESYTFRIFPKKEKQIKLTMAWTDVPGTTPSIALDPTDLMLINDLDVRLIDDKGIEVLPWVLNPAKPDDAPIKGDNFRDNVEQILFNLPKQEPYDIVITHKGTLISGPQNFSLILEYTPVEQPGSVFYWLGKTSDWNDINNWSFSSGGVVAGALPAANDNVIIDSKSFLNGTSEISINDDASCHALSWLSSDIDKLHLNSKLTVNGDIIFDANHVVVDGVDDLVVSSQGDKLLDLGNSHISSLFIDVDDPNIKIEGNPVIDHFKMISGNVSFNDDMVVKSFILSSDLPKKLDFKNSALSNVNSFRVIGSDVEIVSDSGYLVFNSDSISNIIESNNVDFSLKIKIDDGALTLKGQSTYQNISVDGSLKIENDVTMKQLKLRNASSLLLKDQITLTIQDSLFVENELNKVVSIKSLGNSFISFDKHYKFCFDHLLIDGVNIASQAVVSAGVHSDLANASGWQEKECEEVLFPDFRVQYPCANGLTSFMNKSSGNYTKIEWRFDEVVSQEENPYFSFEEPGEHEVSLRLISDALDVDYTRNILVTENPLLENHIVNNGGQLVSFRLGSSYQWFRDGKLIPGANERIFSINGVDGLFTVAVFKDGCNTISEPTLITSLLNDKKQINLTLFPNPVTDELTIDGIITKNSIITITDISGREMYRKKIGPLSNQLKIDTKSWPAGIYRCQIHSSSDTKILKFAKPNN